MSPPRGFAMVLAGGEGKRLLPLTADRAKPAVPFGGGFRLSDLRASPLPHPGVLRIRAPIKLAPTLGVIETAADGRTISRFREKPIDAGGLPDAPDQVFASMGNYVFSTAALVEAVTLDAANETSRHDLGGDIIPGLVERGEAYVWDFARSNVPGVSGIERRYWRDVGTLDAYY